MVGLASYATKTPCAKARAATPVILSYPSKQKASSHSKVNDLHPNTLFMGIGNGLLIHQLQWVVDG